MGSRGSFSLVGLGNAQGLVDWQRQAIGRLAQRFLPSESLFVVHTTCHYTENVTLESNKRLW